MDDIEKNRAEYVARLEAQLQHITGEYEKYKALADKWEPKCTTEMLVNQQLIRVGLTFGGKHSQAALTFSALNETDLTTAVSAVVDALLESNIVARLREVVTPEIERLYPSVRAALGAGKW